jgi:hypothetical protein
MLGDTDVSIDTAESRRKKDRFDSLGISGNDGFEPRTLGSDAKVLREMLKTSKWRLKGPDESYYVSFLVLIMSIPLIENFSFLLCDLAFKNYDAIARIT